MNLPQTPLELISGQLDWANTNITNNLDFIPDDKLNWKPAPEAKSALEIVNHAATTVNFFTSATTNSQPSEIATATNRDEAKALISKVIKAHQQALQTLKPEDLSRSVSLPFGEMPVGMVACLPAVELINHHGQITYIQTLLGDSESHLSLQ